MTLTFKKVLLESVFIGSVFNCVISPSYGMMPEEKPRTNKTYSLKHYQDDITSLPSVEYKINQTEVMFPNLVDILQLHHNVSSIPSSEYKINQTKVLFMVEDVVQLHRDVPFLATQDNGLWVKAAETGGLISFYHLGWFVNQKVKIKHPLLVEELSHIEILKKAKAFYCWERAHYQDDPEAWCELGISHIENSNDSEAMKCFRKAADQNFSLSQVFIGEMYCKGFDEVEEDYTEGMNWILKAADQNFDLAHYMLGRIYFYGKRVEKDYKKARDYFVKASSQINGHEFSYCDFTDEDTYEFAYVLSKAEHLTSINLSGNKCTSQGLKPILKVLESHPNLVELDISRNLIDDEGGQTILTFLETKPSLKVLAGDNPISQEMEEKINKINRPRCLKTNTSDISESTFAYYNFTDEDASQVASLLSKASHLRTIYLSSNKFTSKGLAYILKALESHPNLVKLDISNNLIDDEGGKELLKFLEEKPSLKISVEGNPMSKEMLYSIKKRIEERVLLIKEINRSRRLKTNTKDIKIHTFTCYDFTDEDAPQVASLLSKAEHLTAIYLYFNKFTSKGLAYILKALESHPNLLKLDISNNLIDDEGGKELLNFLEKKPSLKSICVVGNSMSEDMKQSIEKMVKKNNK